MPISYADALAIAASSYNAFTDLPAGFNLIGSPGAVAGDGYFPGLIQAPDGTLVISGPGTMALQVDYVQDAHIFADSPASSIPMFTDLLNYADEVARANPDVDVVLVGHSSFGSAVDYSIEHSQGIENLSGIAINPAALGSVTIGSIANLGDLPVVNIVNRADPISGFTLFLGGQLPGQTQYVVGRTSADEIGYLLSSALYGGSQTGSMALIATRELVYAHNISDIQQVMTRNGGNLVLAKSGIAALIPLELVKTGAAVRFMTQYLLNHPFGDTGESDDGVGIMGALNSQNPQIVQLGSGSFASVGQIFSSGGYSYQVRADGSVENIGTGHIAPGPEARQALALAELAANGFQMTPSIQNDWANAQMYGQGGILALGAGPTVTLASGAEAIGGSEYVGANGVSYTVNDDGSITSGLSNDTYGPGGTPDGSSYDNGSYPGGGNDSEGNPVEANPLILDLNGDGVSITPETSSNMYFDIAGDGEQHLTAWAGAGDGVLVLDDKGDGVIDRKEQVDFTEYDPTAQSDMQALLDVFDTNHDGKLDSGDTDWSEFKVMVTNADGTTSLETLSSLNIASIDLISNNQQITLPDGSKIVGETTYTRTDTTTGTAADASLVYDASGYVVSGTTTVNGDGSTTIDNKAYTSSGVLAQETKSTTSADGLTRTIDFDDNGDHVIDRIQTDVKVLNLDGSITETLENFDSTGTVLKSEQVTTTSPDGLTKTISRDWDGSGSANQSETDATDGSGNLTVTVTDLNNNGSTHDVVATTTSADGLTKTVQTELTGSGVVNATETDDISVDGYGTRTETVTNYAGNATLSANEVSQTVTVTAADGSPKSMAYDLDGNGTTDLTTDDSVVLNGDSSTTITSSDYNGNSSLRDKTVTTKSADGTTTTTSSDIDGDGNYDAITVDNIVVNVGGSITETVTNKSGSGTKLSQTIQTYSADGKTRTIDVDANGDGNNDTVETVAIVGTNSVDTLSTYSPNGVTLVSKVVTTTSADGLTKTVQTDANGDGTYDAKQMSTTVINGGGSATIELLPV